MTVETSVCQGTCGRPLWHSHSVPMPSDLWARHHSKGLCRTCMDKARRAEAPPAPRRRDPATRRPSEPKLRLWEDYADDYDLLRSEGLSLEVIATRLDMKRNTLRDTLRRHAEDPRARRPASDPAAGPRSVPERPWEEYADEYLRLRQAGLTISQVAKELGMSKRGLEGAVAYARRHKDDPRARTRHLGPKNGRGWKTAQEARWGNRERRLRLAA